MVVCYRTERSGQGVPHSGGSAIMASNVATHSATVENTPNVTSTNQCGGGYLSFLINSRVQVSDFFSLKNLQRVQVYGY